MVLYLGNFGKFSVSCIFIYLFREWREYVPVLACPWRSEHNLQEVILPPCGFWVGTKVVKLGIKSLSQEAISLALYFYILLLNGKIKK